MCVFFTTSHGVAKTKNKIQPDASSLDASTVLVTSFFGVGVGVEGGPCTSAEILSADESLLTLKYEYRCRIYFVSCFRNTQCLE